MFLLKKIIIFLSAWETIEGPVEGSVAMDTSSPWGRHCCLTMGAAVEEQQVFSIFFLVPIQQHGLSYILFLQPQEATGWADFEAFSGGGEGMEGKMEQMESIPRISRRLVLKRSRAIEAAVVRRTSRGKASTRRDAGGCGRGGEEDW